MTTHEVQAVLTRAVKAGLNVLLEGPFGVGKSSIAFAVTDELGLRRKYFSTSTLDPYADLVGIPVPVVEGESRRILFLRPQEIMLAQVLFFDELNRAHPRVLNAVFEIIQFHSINGEKLPYLQCVIAAINPADAGYQVQELDAALLDRFHLHLHVDPGPCREWFQDEFGPLLGNALVDWYTLDLDVAQKALVSSRRLEYLGRTIQTDLEPKHAVTGPTPLPVHLLLARLREDASVLSVEAFVHDPAKYCETVARDLEVALRFADLLPTMSARQKCKVKEIVLSLPTEALAKLARQHPKVFQKVRDSIPSRENHAEADAFWALLKDRLDKLSPPHDAAAL